MPKPAFEFKPTTTLTTNRNNWSGEDITVKVDRENLAWEQYDYLFWMEFHPWPEAERDILGEGRYKVFGDGWNSGQPLCTVSLPSEFDIKRARNGGGKPWALATEDPGLESGLTRESDRDPTVDRDLAAIEAAVRVLCNTI